MPDPLRPITEPPDPQPASDRLESWKDIANYLGREVRTVQGWEKNEGLPVHRHLHSRLGTVYAFRKELDAWRKERAAVPEAPALQSETKTLAVSKTFFWILGVAAALVLGAVIGLGVWETRRLSPASGTPSSIAVLPFSDFSPGKDQEYFSDGLTEEIIDALSRVPNLHVVARTSAFQFKGKAVDIREIGHRLNVGAVLEGSVRKSGDQLRITAQLNRVSDGFHLWSRTYDRPFRDIFALQREISQAIVTQLGAGQVSPRSTTTNLEAYRLYLQGRYAMAQPTKERIDTAIACYRQALAKDPDYALAYAGLADSFSYLGDEGMSPPREVMVQAKTAAQKALQIDGRIAEAHASLGIVALLFEWDWPTAEKEFRLALELSPGNAYNHHWFGHYFDALGRYDEGLAEMKKALDLDPLSEMFHFDHAIQLGYVSQWDASLAEFRQVQELSPQSPYAHSGLAYLFERTGRPQDALAELNLAAPMEASAPVMAALDGTTYARLGKKEEAKKLLARLQELSKKSYVPAFYGAIVSFSLGGKDQGFAYLDQAYADRSSGFTFMLPQPEFDSVRSDPRFVRLMEKVGVPRAAWARP